MGMNAMEAINQLDNNWELSKEEKRELNNLEKKDYVQAKNQLWDTTITAYWENITVKDAVNQIAKGEMNTEGLKWDNWAKIQAYLIANNADIGTYTSAKLWIDGSLWKNSKDAITKVAREDTQQQKIDDLQRQLDEQRQLNNSEDTEVRNISQLLAADFKDYVWDYQDEQYNLISQSGNNEWQLISAYQWSTPDSLVIYYGKIWSWPNGRGKKSITIENVSTFKSDKNSGKLSCKKIWAEIQKKIQESEKSLEMNKDINSIKEGLKNITANDYENPTVKKFFKDTHRNFQLWMLPTIVGKSIAIFDGKKSYSIPKETLLKDWKFQTDSFIQYMGKQYEEIAIQYCEQDFNKRINQLKIPDKDMNANNWSNINTMWLPTQRSKTAYLWEFITKCNHIIKEMDIYQKHWCNFEQQRQTVSNIIDQTNKKINYISSKDKLTNIIPEIEDRFDGVARLRYRSTKTQETQKLLNSIWISSTLSHNDEDITIHNNNKIHNDFKNVNKEYEYNNLINQIQNIFQTYNWWKFTVDA